MTKNITLAVDEGLLARYRLLAAERRTSVNAMVRQHMEDAIGQEERRRSAIARMLDLGQKTEARIDMSHWARDVSYARGKRG